MFTENEEGDGKSCKQPNSLLSDVIQDSDKHPRTEREEQVRTDTNIINFEPQWTIISLSERSKDTMQTVINIDSMLDNSIDTNRTGSCTNLPTIVKASTLEHLGSPTRTDAAATEHIGIPTERFKEHSIDEKQPRTLTQTYVLLQSSTTQPLPSLRNQLSSSFLYPNEFQVLPLTQIEASPLLKRRNPTESSVSPKKPYPPDQIQPSPFPKRQKKELSPYASQPPRLQTQTPGQEGDRDFNARTWRRRSLDIQEESKNIIQKDMLKTDLAEVDLVNRYNYAVLHSTNSNAGPTKIKYLLFSLQGSGLEIKPIRAKVG